MELLEIICCLCAINTFMLTFISATKIFNCRKGKHEEEEESSDEYEDSYSDEYEEESSREEESSNEQEEESLHEEEVDTDEEDEKVENQVLDDADLEIINEIRKFMFDQEKTKDSQSMDDLKEKLVTIVKNIAETLDKETSIPSTRRKELTNLFQMIPEFIAGTEQAKLPDSAKESEILLRTLDSLRG